MVLESLSKDYPIEKSFLMIPKFSLSRIGLYPKTQFSYLQIANSAFHVVVVFLAVLAQFWYGFYYLKLDTPKGIDALCSASTSIVTFLKINLICFCCKQLSPVLDHLQTLLLAEMNDLHGSIRKHYMTKATRLAYLVPISGLSAEIVYSLQPIISNFIRLSKGMDYIFQRTPLQVMVPSVLLTLPWYPFTYASVSYFILVAIYVIAGIDGMYLYFCMYAAALLKILQHDVIATLAKYKTKMTPEENERSLQQLRRIVERHNEIIDIVREFSSLFMWITLTHLVTSSVVLGASIIQGLMFSGLRVLLCISFSLTIFIEVFLYCYGGNEILENSFGVGMAAFSSNWHLSDIRVRKMILMIIIRSQKPLKMRCPFFTPSLVTFASIIQTAGSIITLAKSVFKH